MGIPTIERLRIFNLRYLMERLRVVTAEQREGFLFVVCQCPHGLELLRQIHFINKFAKMFQCPHGLELLQRSYCFAAEEDLFQCPHGLELLLQECPIS